MSRLIQIEGVGFQYPGRQEASLREIDLCVNAGELLLLTGPTGCGKSTLLKVMAGIIPQESSGALTGRALVDGLDTRQTSLPRLASKVGLVFQSPDDQLCATTIGDEVAFGPENLGLSPSEVDQRRQWALARVGLSGHETAQTSRLSGGQKQRVAIAAQLAMRPKILTLDEPISQLDPKGAREVLECLARLAAQGLAVVLVEHRLGECMELASRLAVLSEGRLVLDAPGPEVADHLDVLEGLGLKVPDLYKARRHWRVQGQGELDQLLAGLKPAPSVRLLPERQAVLCLQEVSFTYLEAPRPSLCQVSLEIYPGEVLAVVGANGAGKSTLLGMLAGLYKPSQGRIFWRGKLLKKRAPAGKVGLLMQNPDLLLLEHSLGRELMSGPKLLGLARPESTARRLAEQMDLAECWEAPPWALSKGQRLRAALGAILATRPEVLLLDEPTTGQNQANIHRLLRALQEREPQAAMVLCSHDLETVARFADRTAVLRKGRMVDLGPTRQVLARLGKGPGSDLTPHWPLRTSLRLGIDPPFLTLEEMLAAGGPLVGPSTGRETLACSSIF